MMTNLYIIYLEEFPILLYNDYKLYKDYGGEYYAGITDRKREQREKLSPKFP